MDKTCKGREKTGISDERGINIDGLLDRENSILSSVGGGLDNKLTMPFFF